MRNRRTAFTAALSFALLGFGIAAVYYDSRSDASVSAHVGMYALCSVPVLLAWRFTRLGVLIDPDRRCLWVVRMLRSRRIEFDDVLDARTVYSESNGAIYPVIVERDGTQHEVKMLQRGAYFPELFERPDNFQPYLDEILRYVRDRPPTSGIRSRR